MLVGYMRVSSATSGSRWISSVTRWSAPASMRAISIPTEPRELGTIAPASRHASPGSATISSRCGRERPRRSSFQTTSVAVVPTPPADDDVQIVGAERPMPHQVGLVLGQGE